VAMNGHLNSRRNLKYALDAKAISGRRNQMNRPKIIEITTTSKDIIYIPLNKILSIGFYDKRDWKIRWGNNCYTYISKEEALKVLDKMKNI